MNDIIRMHYAKPKSIKVKIEDAYNPIILNWRQKFAWWLVKKTGAAKEYYEENTVYEQLEFSASEFFNKILEAKIRIFNEHFYNKNPSIIYIGSEDFADLMNSKKARDAGFFAHTISFNVTARFDAEIYNLPVKVLPYMRGCLIV